MGRHFWALTFIKTLDCSSSTLTCSPLTSSSRPAGASTTSLSIVVLVLSLSLLHIYTQSLFATTNRYTHFLPLSLFFSSTPSLPLSFSSTLSQSLFLSIFHSLTNLYTLISPSLSLSRKPSSISFSLNCLSLFLLHCSWSINLPIDSHSLSMRCTILICDSNSSHLILVSTFSHPVHIFDLALSHFPFPLSLSLSLSLSQILFVARFPPSIFCSPSLRIAVDASRVLSPLRSPWRPWSEIRQLLLLPGIRVTEW